MVVEVSSIDSSKDDTTFIIPFAFYFNERPQGVDYKLFAANETDTVWMGQVWAEKSWLAWSNCMGTIAYEAAAGCIFAMPAYLQCVAGMLAAKGIGCLFKG